VPYWSVSPIFVNTGKGAFCLNILLDKVLSGDINLSLRLFAIYTTMLIHGLVAIKTITDDNNDNICILSKINCYAAH